MRKIRIIEFISLDGVIQAPGGPGEDGDYPHGGWAVPHSDPAVEEAIEACHGEAFDLLLGRRTYDIWSAYWPKAESGLMADSLNVSFRMEPRHANSLSSTRRLRPRASSSALTGPADLCGPAPSTKRRREPTFFAFFRSSAREQSLACLSKEA
jgi:hypothetical protein